MLLLCTMVCYRISIHHQTCFVCLFSFSFLIINLLPPSLGFTPPHIACRSALGLQDRRLSDNKITASSQWNAFHGPERSRLHTHKTGTYTGAWSSRVNDKGQWLQVDLGHVSDVEGIATQGRQDADQWVKSYSLAYSIDGGHYEDYTDIKVYQAKRTLQ